MSGDALLTEVRRLAAGGRAHVESAPARFDADDWRVAEQTLAPEVAGRDGDRLVRAFERVASTDGSPTARGRAARLRGSYLSLRGRHEESLVPYETAEALLRASARDGARVGRAGALLRLARYDEAGALLRKTRTAARRRGDVVLAAAADLNLGIAESEAGRPRRALAPLERALDAFRSAGIVLHAGLAEQSRGVALLLLDRFEDARCAFAAASELLRAAGEDGESARCLFNEGILLHDTGHLGDALDTLERAGARLSSSGATEIAAQAAVERGAVLLDAGLPEDALDTLRTARRWIDRRVAPGERARARLLHAAALVATGDTGTAARLLRGDTAPFDAEAHELRGRIAAHRGDMQAAIEALDAAARHARRDRPSVAARCLALAATCALRDGDRTSARRLARRALTAAHVVDLPDAVFASTAALFLVEDAANRRAHAAAALDDALEALDRVRTRRGSVALRESLLAGREAWFARAVAHTLDRDGPDAALTLAERWRSRALLDLLTSTTHRDDDVSRVRAELAALEARLERDASAGPVRGPAIAARRLHARVHRAERSLVRALQASHSVSPVPEAELARVRRTLPADTLVLSLTCLDGETLMVDVARPDEFHRLPIADDRVARALSDVRIQLGRLALGTEFVSRHGARMERALGDALRRIAVPLLTPIGDRLRAARRVVFVPDGSWHGVPFGALPFDAAPLAASIDVTACPAVALLTDALPRARGAPVVLGVVDALAPSMSAEARAVAQHLGPRTRLFEGDDATYDSLRRRRNPRCLHVAAHGRFRKDRPEMSAMRLADGWLRAAEWPRLALDGSLVVLSGCDTGATALRGGELAGLVRGVFAAGASDVVTGLFTIGDAPTLRLMRRFHAALRAHRDPAVALGRTQSSAARLGLPSWEWCAFTTWSRRLAAR